MTRKLCLLAVIFIFGLASSSNDALASRCNVTVAEKACQEGYDFMETNFKSDKIVHASMKALHGFCGERFKGEDKSENACMLGGFENLLHKIKPWAQ